MTFSYYMKYKKIKWGLASSLFRYYFIRIRKLYEKIEKSCNAVSFILTYIVFHLREIEIRRVYLASVSKRDVTWQ